MAGVVSQCKQCHKDIYDEDTALKNCIHCGKEWRKDSLQVKVEAFAKEFWEDPKRSEFWKDVPEKMKPLFYQTPPLTPSEARNELRNISNRREQALKEFAQEQDEVQQRCMHDWKYHYDPAGGSDSGYCCEGCDLWTKHK